MATIALTGATGHLGRNILFQIFKSGFHQGTLHNVLILGKSSGTTTLQERIRQILKEDGLNYLAVSQDQSEPILEEIMAHLHFVNADMEAKELGLSQEDREKLRSFSVDVFIQNAGLTNFRHDDVTASKCMKANVDGIREVLSVVETMKIGKFFQISSAYSSGKLFGYIQPDTLDINGDFANPYQKSKSLGENLVREFSAKHNDIAVHIFRPSTIGGRLLEMPFGATSKFDVFYGWAKAFVRMKVIMTGSWDKVYEDPISTTLGIAANSEAGLNIIPVDFCAKMIVHAALNGVSDRYVHIANHQSTPHKLYIQRMLDAIKITGAEIVSEEPADKSEAEMWYYNALHPIYGAYIIHPVLDFDLQAMKKLEHAANVFCPLVDESNFDIFMQYAVAHNFGLERR